MTCSVYLVAYHSRRAERPTGTGQFWTVEDAITRGEWPYDNGDDPSFYVARHGGSLTWGVCRQDVRNRLKRHDIVVFFSYGPTGDGQVEYRLTAVATVADRLDHTRVHIDSRLTGLPYINSLIRPGDGYWCYDENDRPKPNRHEDWLWRIADHNGLSKSEFSRVYAGVYRHEQFSEWAISSGSIVLGCNYIVFSDNRDETLICSCPPVVAVAFGNQTEQWSNLRLKRLTVYVAGKHGCRDYLRAGKASAYRHRQIRFEMEPSEAVAWRETLMEELGAF